MATRFSEFAVGANLHVNHVVVTRVDDGHWRIEDSDPQIGTSTAREAWRQIRQSAKRYLQITRSSATLIYEVEWRNVPDDFIPPGAE